jgi:Fungal specific transcription factor domain
MNRAIQAVGYAFRSAQSLGMHLVGEDNGGQSSQGGLRTRIWRSICGLELFLAFISGRPSNFISEPLSTDILSNVDDDGSWDHLWDNRHNKNNLPNPFHSSSDGANLLSHNISVDIILSDVVQTLYDSTATRLSWDETQSYMERLNSSLDDWHSEISPSRNFDLDNTDRTPLRKRPISNFEFSAPE